VVTVVARAEVSPQPFRQGDLDALCGCYAVVNAVRLAALPRRRLGRAACLGLFAALVDELAEAGRLRAFVTGGVGTGTLARLLRRAAAWLEAEHGLALEVRRPFRGGDRLDAGARLRLLAEHLAQGGTSAIVGTGDHWTVVSVVRGGRLLLADSHDRRYYVAAKAFGKAAAASRLHLPGTFLLGVATPSGP
jgi:hypothetical protein